MQTLEQWRSFYDAWAGHDPRIASTGQVVPDAVFARLAGTLGDWLALSGRERVLDVGCASGTLTSLWSPRAKEVIGLDFSRPLALDASRRHARRGLSFLQGEAARLPFPDASFDRVCCYNVLLSMPDRAYVDRALSEILRVARPRARVVLGSLPDVARKARFFDLLDQASPWYRRMVPRNARWRMKRLLKPGSKPGETRMLWFDLPELAARSRSAGWSVELHADPAIEDYPEYRSTLVLARGFEAGEAA